MSAGRRRRHFSLRVASAKTPTGALAMAQLFLGALVAVSNRKRTSSTTTRRRRFRSSQPFVVLPTSCHKRRRRGLSQRPVSAHFRQFPHKRPALTRSPQPRVVRGILVHVFSAQVGQPGLDVPGGNKRRDVILVRPCLYSRLSAGGVQLPQAPENTHVVSVRHDDHRPIHMTATASLQLLHIGLSDKALGGTRPRDGRSTRIPR